MAAKKTKSEIAIRNPALPAELAKMFAGVVDTTARATAGISSGGWAFLSTRGGQFTLSKKPLGDVLKLIVLGGIRENVYYEGDYDPENPSPPTCFALGYEAAEMAPTIAEPQAPKCSACWANAWGSGKGRGKACKNVMRLAVIPGDNLDPEVLAKITGARMRLPVTSVAAFADYQKLVSEGEKRPLWSVVSEVTVVPDAKTQYRLTFEAVQSVNVARALNAIKLRMEEATPTLEAVPDLSTPPGEAPQRPAPRAKVPVQRGVAAAMKPGKK